MSSSSILPNLYVNKLQVNKLKAVEIKAVEIKAVEIKAEKINSDPSYLFSVLFQKSIFTKNPTGGTLTFNLNEQNNNVIMFSDRPFRQTSKITIEEFVNAFRDSGTNSFEKDPPNAVLTHSEEQRTYIVRFSEQNNNSVTFNLELLPGETHNLDTVTGAMNLFVDSFVSWFKETLDISGATPKVINRD